MRSDVSLDLDRQPKERSIRRIVFSAYVGTALEYYDYFLFGTTAAIVFAPLFFPGNDPTLSTIAAFLSFAVGFIGRPIGALIFGYIGDRYGRRAALVLSVVLMGLASSLIGALPTYASVGLWAPIILTTLRLVQGVAVGGEWTGATLFAIEHADPKRRGFYASLVQIGIPTGTLLSSAAVAGFALLPEESFMTWGWRIPFLVSIVLLGLGLWLRWTAEETPVFREISEQSNVAKNPVLSVLKQAPGRLAVAIISYFFVQAGFYVITTYMISYATSVRHMPASVILNAMTIGAAGEIVALYFVGRLATRIGSVRVVIIGHILSLLLAFPIFLVVDTGNAVSIAVFYVVALSLICMTLGPVGHVLTTLFPARLAFSGVALASGIAAALAGFTPAVATYVASMTSGHSWGPATLLAIIALVSLLGNVIVLRIVGHDRATGQRHVEVGVEESVPDSPRI